jgi:hypothetical protein
MAAPIGPCWLCGKVRPLTREHIPPEAAFNDCPLLLQRVSELSSRAGELEWTPGTQFREGMWFRSLCEKCNNKYGRWYGPAYVNLVKRIAERVGDIQTYHTILIAGVHKPLEILKQVVMQFVTANGANFVRANEWVSGFVRNQTNQSIPGDVHIYAFASNMRGARTTGVSAHLDLAGRKENVVAEFSFWPLGTVMSWNALGDRRLTPIHHWKEYSFNDRRTVDLNLTVNPTASAYPIDFRTEDEIRKGPTTSDIAAPAPSALDDMINKAIRTSGGSSKDWIFSGHPSTADVIRKSMQDPDRKE